VRELKGDAQHTVSSGVGATLRLRHLTVLAMWVRPSAGGQQQSSGPEAWWEGEDARPEVTEGTEKRRRIHVKKTA